MIYLDNAATSYPKPETVINGMVQCMKDYCANPGRGGHALSVASGKAVMEARETISSFFGIKNPLQLSFTKNATEAINVGIKGILKPGDHVISTSMEHNSVVRPLKTLEKESGIEVTFIRCSEFGELDIEDLKKNIKKNTKMIVSTLSSNVNGIIMPVGDIGKVAREKGILFLLDASQGAGTIKIDVEEIGADLLAFPGHKALLGPQGTGGLYVKEGIKINTLIQGGTGSHSENLFQPDFMPDMLESGTVNTPGIIGLSLGIKFIENMGLDILKSNKFALVKRLWEGANEVKQIKLYSKNDIHKNSGIVALNFEGVDSSEVSYVLDKVYGIATRAGLHCAPMAHETIGTRASGLVRFSIGCFNTMEEIDHTIRALEEIGANLK
ncbi:MAG: aminotransferase class V-fold PLP-dependent enzyme [Clostridia bacterium]|nr:aminotransferase class V-fold PLP-dependent enzyme [Clostridia bacterium]